MKKLMPLILALVMALSLCACGTDNPENDREDPTASLPINDNGQPVPPATEPSEPAEPEIPNLDMFVGQWVYMSTSAVEQDFTFTINPDGTLEHEGETYTWEAMLTPESSLYEMRIDVKRQKDPSNPNVISLDAYTIRLTRTEENTYVANFKRSGSMGTGTDCYRVGDYEIVELTGENVMEYLEVDEYFTYNTNDFGYTKTIYKYTDIRFKEGIGFPSFCLAEFVYRITEKEVTFEEKPEGYTVGQTLNSYEGAPNIWSTSTPKVTGQYPYSFYFTYNWINNEGGEQHTETVSFYELLGTDQVLGKVYIPVEK